jgi:hypothetical protein
MPDILWNSEFFRSRKRYSDPFTTSHMTPPAGTGTSAYKSTNIFMVEWTKIQSPPNKDYEQPHTVLPPNELREYLRLRVLWFQTCSVRVCRPAYYVKACTWKYIAPHCLKHINACHHPKHSNHITRNLFIGVFLLNWFDITIYFLKDTSDQVAWPNLNNNPHIWHCTYVITVQNEETGH